MKHTWHNLMKIIELEHRDREGKLLHREENLTNLLHLAGEQFILMAVFTGGGGLVPEKYWLGLDNRDTPAAEDTLGENLIEPAGYTGYARQGISSSGEFAVDLDNGHYVAMSNIVSFVASGGYWGPVRNLFLASTEDNSGALISSIVLTSPITVQDGDYIKLRVSLSLQTCS